MKAVVYHADGPIAKGFPDGLYQALFEKLKQNLHKFNIQLIHVTVNGHPGWGDQNFYIDGDPEHIVYNREIGFVEFLRTAPDDVYWFTEPDARLVSALPPLQGDLALLRRKDSVAITPWWRLARPSALPFFEEVLTHFNLDHKTWHGDSYAFVGMWNAMGCPDIGHMDYKGLKIELRDYAVYTGRKGPYSRQWKAHHKLDLYNSEQGKQ
jgi:hypothetical protein